MIWGYRYFWKHPYIAKWGYYNAADPNYFLGTRVHSIDPRDFCWIMGYGTQFFSSYSIGTRIWMSVFS